MLMPFISVCQACQLLQQLVYTYIHIHHYSPNQMLVIKLNVIQVNTIVPMITAAPDQLQTSKRNGNTNSQTQSQFHGNILQYWLICRHTDTAKDTKL
jgi:hypothetical protein